MVMPSRARHPRSRAERQLLDRLQATLSAALDTCENSVGDQMVAALAAPPPAPLAYMPTTAPHLSSNGDNAPTLYYAPSREAGIGLKGLRSADILPPLPADDAGARRAKRTDAPNFQPSRSARPSSPSLTPPLTFALPRHPRARAAARRYGVQQLTDYARSQLLGEVSDYLPTASVGGETARQRFDALLSRVQQHQMAATVRNELAARERVEGGMVLDAPRYHLAPLTGRAHRTIPIDSWAYFIRIGGDPASEQTHGGGRLEIVSQVRAERAEPTQRMVSVP